jgi:hypothetical protein
MTGSNAVILAYTVGIALILGYAARVWLLQRRLNRRDRVQDG